jgi:hypothetical protein
MWRGVEVLETEIVGFLVGVIVIEGPSELQALEIENGAGPQMFESIDGLYTVRAK